MKHLSTTLLIVALLLVPAAVWGETSHFKTWHNRLVIPYLVPEPDRHTPLHLNGTFLPSSINQDLTLTPTDNPILLTGNTHIEPGATLTLTAGTTVYAQEFASLTVSGHLAIQGTSKNPALFTSNELHPLNQTWGGIIVTSTGQATATHAIFRYASPTLTCLDGSYATFTNTHTTDTILPAFNSNPNCYVRTL